MILTAATARWVAKIQKAATMKDLEAIGEQIKEAIKEEADADLAAASCPYPSERPDQEVIQVKALRQHYAAKRTELKSLKIAGTSHRQAAVRRCKVGDQLELVKDPLGMEAARRSGLAAAKHNDPKAVLLLHAETRAAVGYLPRLVPGTEEPLAARYFDALEARKKQLFARVVAVVGGGHGWRGKRLDWGLRVLLPEID